MPKELSSARSKTDSESPGLIAESTKAKIGNLVILLNNWAGETTPEGRAAVAAVLRSVARDAVSEAS
jgi:hypothetical protein